MPFALAAAVVASVAFQVPIARRDRLVFVCLLAVLYGAVLTGLRSVLSLAAQLAIWKPKPGLAPEYALAFAMVLVSRVLTPFGRKPLMVREVTWPLTCGPLVEILAIATVLVVGFALFLMVQPFVIRAVRFLRPAVLAAVAVGCLLLPPGPVRIGSARDVPSAIASGESARPLIVLGLDGVDGVLLDRALKTGRLPALERISKNGFSGALDNEDYGLSPAIWTSLITGKDWGVHQISDFRQIESPLFEGLLAVFRKRGPAGFGINAVLAGLEYTGLVRARFVDGRDRRGPSVWQILSRHGRRSLVVNYMTSYPAERINGVFLSQFIYHVSGSGATPSGFQYPEGFLAHAGLELAPQHVSDASASPAAIHDSESEPGTRGSSGAVGVERADEREFDALASVTLELMRRERFDLVTFYTPWPDAFNHSMSVADYDEIVSGRFMSSRPAAFLLAYQKLDAFAAALRALAPDANVILLSDHGVRTAWHAYRFPEGDITILLPQRIERAAFPVRKVLQHLYGCPGIVLADGPDILPGRGPDLSFRDLTPTLLAYFGVPLAEDMPGRPMTGVLRPATRRRSVSSYDSIIPNDRVDGLKPEIDRLRQQRLRALGYVQ
jgi:hypothetical protein